MQLDAKQLENLIPVLLIVLGTTSVALPAILFSSARKIIRDHEHLAGMILGIAALVAAMGIVVGGTLVLALIGWLPSPSEFLSLRP